MRLRLKSRHTCLQGWPNWVLHDQETPADRGPWFHLAPILPVPAEAAVRESGRSDGKTFPPKTSRERSAVRFQTDPLPKVSTVER